MFFSIEITWPVYVSWLNRLRQRSFWQSPSCCLWALGISKHFLQIPHVALDLAPFKGFPTFEFSLGQTMVACSGVPVAFRTTSFAETWKIQFKIGKFSSVNRGFMRFWSCEECPWNCVPQGCTSEWKLDRIFCGWIPPPKGHKFFWTPQVGPWDVREVFDKEYYVVLCWQVL